MAGSEAKGSIWARIRRAAGHQKARWTAVALLSSAQASAAGAASVAAATLAEGKVGLAIAEVLVAGFARYGFESVNAYVSMRAAEEMHREMIDDALEKIRNARPGDLNEPDENLHASLTRNMANIENIIANGPRNVAVGVAAAGFGTTVTLLGSGAALVDSLPIIAGAAFTAAAGVTAGVLQIPKQLKVATAAEYLLNQLDRVTRQLWKDDREYLQSLGAEDPSLDIKDADEEALIGRRKVYLQGLLTNKSVDLFVVTAPAVPLILNETLGLHLPFPTLVAAFAFNAFLGGRTSEIESQVRKVPALKANLINVEAVCEAADVAARERARQLEKAHEVSVVEREPMLPMLRGVDVVSFENVVVPMREDKSGRANLLHLDCELRLPPGHREIVVAGPSGTGKSTAFPYLLLGLRTPVQGRVLFNGVDIKDLDSREYMKLIAWLPQTPRLSHMTVKDAWRAVSPVDGRDEFREMLDRLHLRPSVFDAPIVELSGGEQSRVRLAMALMKHPRILLLDEPTAALDPAAANAVDHVVRQSGAVVLRLTHHLLTREGRDEALFLEPNLVGDVYIRNHLYPWAVSPLLRATDARSPLRHAEHQHYASELTDPVARSPVATMREHGLQVNRLYLPVDMGDDELRQALVPVYKDRKGITRRSFTLHEAAALIASAPNARQPDMQAVAAALTELGEYERVHKYGTGMGMDFDEPKEVLLVEPRDDRLPDPVMALLDSGGRSLEF